MLLQSSKQHNTLKYSLLYTIKQLPLLKRERIGQLSARLELVVSISLDAL